METHESIVAVVGAGPAGLFAARQLANRGAQVVLFNRDVKPGGLAEYGIYYDKYKMKAGLRKQFQRILQEPGLHYRGNIVIGDDPYRDASIGHFAHGQPFVILVRDDVVEPQRNFRLPGIG